MTVQTSKVSLWGHGTAVALDKLAISGKAPHPRLIDALILIKKACAIANAENGRLETKKKTAIVAACDEILEGKLRDQFVVDPFAPGRYLNLNVNEVLANLAAQILGQEAGADLLIDADKDVNCGQSENDVYPTAARLAVLLNLKELEPAIVGLERLLRRKSLEFEKVIKTGRAHLQDSLPISLGQELNAYGSSVQRGYLRINEAGRRLLEISIGATTIGTGVNSTTAFAQRVTALLAQFSGFKLTAGDDFFRLSQSANDFLEFSSSLKELAVELTRIANDLRLMASGPLAGLGEINLPQLMAGQAIFMPGVTPERNNPDLAESLNMVCFQVMGNDLASMLACQAGQLEVNVMLPLVAHNLLTSMDLLKEILRLFNQYCIAGMTANQSHCHDHLQATGAIAYALSAEIGYEQAALIFQESIASGKTINAIVLEKKLLSAETLEKVLHYKSLAAYTRPGFLSDTTGGGTAGDNKTRARQ